MLHFKKELITVCKFLTAITVATP